MSRIIGVGLILVLLLGMLGIFIPWVYKARLEQDFRRCQDHQRQIGSFAFFHSALPDQPIPKEARDRFPSGTLVNPNLSFEKRLSWYALILGALDQGQAGPGGQPRKPGALGELIKEIDVNLPWDAEAHQRVAHYRLTVALCPGVSHDQAPGQNEPTNYLGMGGVGVDTPSQSWKVPGADTGVFNYNQAMDKQAIVAGDGLSNTISLAETNDRVGPWLQGGPATVRGLDPKNQPYLGLGRPFGGCHLGRGNYCYADGSVRVITNTINSALFRSLLTVAGHENGEDFY